MFRSALAASALVLVASFAAAADVPKAVEAAIRAKLGAAMADAEITSVSASPVAGLYEVVLDGGETAYVSGDGQYLVSGDLYRTTAKGLVNVSDERKEPLRQQALQRVKPADMITFQAQGKEKSELFVFTDVDCGYCRKMHQEVPQLNAAGVTVHYLAFPRSGPDGATARKMESAWCAVDRNAAMTELKKGRALPAAPMTCRSPIADQYRLGASLGVNGTPAVFTPTGKQIGGYLSTPAVLSSLGLR